MPMLDLLWDHATTGLVEYNFFSGWNPKGYSGSLQQWAYMDCLNRYEYYGFLPQLD